MWALTSGGPTETTEALVTRGAVEACVHLVHVGADAYIRRCALTAIANLLNVDERSRSMVLDEGGMDHVLEAFRSTRDPDMQKAGIRCVMSLSKHLETRSLLFAQADFVHLLLGLATSVKEDATAYFIAATLATVTKKEDFTMKVMAHENVEGEKDALKPLLKLTDCGLHSDDVVAEGVRAIFNITSCVHNLAHAGNELLALLQADPVMDRLRALAGPMKTIEIRCVAADALGILTANRDQIMSLEAEFGLNFGYGQVDPKQEEEAQPAAE
eukprot:TRINITY_DN7830_c0_g1_i8.p1 TRINITY_DN7830_c0_g1~~TRINITY_DN7830_c0_g1_i8.p1  ORF type:complete len:271 (-),score=70.83 TRINITY_DN7830_c0_g1_i8:44-856(-)